MNTSENISDCQSIAFGNSENGRLWRFQNTEYQYKYNCKTTPNSTGKELDPLRLYLQSGELCRARLTSPPDLLTGYSYFGARYLDHTFTTSWLSVDPMADKYPSISPYAYCAWNPVKLVDPEGMEISTHIDQDGNVVAVFNDGDNGVYQHQRNADGSSVTEYQLSKRAAKYGSSCGGVRIGETEYWDEFVSPEDGKAMTNYKLQIGKSFDPIIRDLHSKAMKMNLIEIANNSKSGELFDMKNNYPDVGALLNGKYATSRSAGNFLAGYNAESGSYLGFSVSFKTFQQLAGALHIEESNGRGLSKRQMADIVLWGYYNSNSDQSNYKPPTWGEVTYQYRRSLEGWNYGLNH